MVTDVLLLDSGNTRLKYRYNNETGVFETFSDLKTFLVTKKPNFVLYASVSDNERTLNIMLDDLNCRFAKAVVQDAFLGLSLAYKNFYTLGVDRWLSMLAAIKLYPEKPLTVVNAGTALTIDCIDSNKEHKGGSISPGLCLSLAALHSKAALLPEVRPNITLSLGTDTASCMNYGITHSLLALIEMTVKRFDTSSMLLMSGGDAPFLADFLNIKHQKVPDLVLQGLELYYEVSYKCGAIK